MTPLMPCPRCTQLLPATAGFCRRCGVSVRTMAAPMPAPAGRVRSWVGAAFAITAGVVALVVVGLVGLYVALSTTPQPAAATSAFSAPLAAVPKPMPPRVTPPRVVYPLTVPRVYPPTFSVPPGYPPARTFTPVYPRSATPGAQENWAAEQPPRSGRR